MALSIARAPARSGPSVRAAEWRLAGSDGYGASDIGVSWGGRDGPLLAVTLPRPGGRRPALRLAGQRSAVQTPVSVAAVLPMEVRIRSQTSVAASA